MGVLYFIEGILCLGLACLILIPLYRLFNYETKKVDIELKNRKAVKVTVDDPDYHYKGEELVETPNHWKTWKKR